MLGLLGKGAMGKVYKAVQPSLNRLVAIKVLPERFVKDEAAVERFEREAQAVALLNHPNVVQIIDKNREEDLLYFVMEYVPGTSLEAVMRQRRLSLPEVFRVAKSICRGLEAAHRQNIVHRDLNPRNVLVSEDLSVVKLADFGISRVESISREQGTLSTSEVSLGSLHYMAPEQASNMLEADHRADIYSLGVTLYEMLTGRVPVGRFSLPSQINTEVPSDIDPLVLKCLEADPTDRFATVGQVLGDLNRLEDRLKLGLVHELKGISQHTSKIFLRSTDSFRARKRPLIIAAVAAAVLIGGGAAWFFLRRPAPATGAATAPAAEAATAPDTEAAMAPDSEAATAPAASGEGAMIGLEMPERPEATAPETPSGPPPEVEPPPAAEAPAKAPAEAAAEAPDEAPLSQAREDLRVAREKLAAGLNEPAMEALERFIEERATSPLVPEAYLLMAEAHRAEGRTEQALATYIEIGSRFGDSPQAPAAAFERAQLVEKGSAKEAAEQARQLYAALAIDHQGTTWAPPALAAQARIEDDLKMAVTDPVVGGRAPASLGTCRALAEQYPTTAEAEWALWRLGEAYADLKKFDLAAESFSELGRRFPRTKRDAWWRAGQILDRRLDRKEEAVEAYLQVSESSTHYADAQKRIGRLAR